MAWLKCSKDVAAKSQNLEAENSHLFPGIHLVKAMDARNEVRHEDRMTRPPRLHPAFFDRPVLKVAADLIGATLLFRGVGGMIVEVEAYHHTDPAAHCARG